MVKEALSLHKYEVEPQNQKVVRREKILSLDPKKVPRYFPSGGPKDDPYLSNTEH